MKSILFFVGLIFVLSGLILGAALAFEGAFEGIYLIIIIAIGLVLIGFSGIIDRLDKIINLIEKE